MQKNPVVAIIQARAGSTRLPGKVFMPLSGKPMLFRQLERVKAAKRIDAIVVATTDTPEDDAIVQIAKDAGTRSFRGSERDVLDRYYRAAKEVGATTVVRITGDCPLYDPAVLDQVVLHFLEAEGKYEYTNTPSNYPEGLDTEVFSFAALLRAWKEAKLPSEREHVTLYIRNHPELFPKDVWQEGDRDDSSLHWSVDTKEDFAFVTAVYAALYRPDVLFHKDDVLALLERIPELCTINAGSTGYEGLATSIKEDEDWKKSHAY